VKDVQLPRYHLLLSRHVFLVRISTRKIALKELQKRSESFEVVKDTKGLLIPYIIYDRGRVDFYIDHFFFDAKTSTVALSPWRTNIPSRPFSRR